MYEDETPKSEFRFQMFGLGRETLKAIAGQHGFRQLFDDQTLKIVEQKARGLLFAEHQLSADLVEQWLEKAGDVCLPELEELFPDCHQRINGYLQEMIAKGKAWVFSGPRQGLIVSKWQAPIYLQALPGLEKDTGEKFHQPQDLARSAMEKLPPDEARRSIIHCYVRSHGPFNISAIVNRYGFGEQEVGAELAIMAAENIIEAGEFIPGGMARNGAM
jgi:hypothetical protein